MSQALEKAIQRRLDGSETLTGNALTNSTALIAALGKDRNSATGSVLGPAVVQGEIDDNVEFDCITWSLNGGNRLLDAIDIGNVGNRLIDVSYWTKHPDRGRLSVLDGYVEQLLDETMGAPVLTLDTGVYFWMDAFTELSNTFLDQRTNARFALRRFRIVEARYQSA